MEEARGLTVYCGCTPVVDAEFDPAGDRNPGTVVAEAIAGAAEVDPMALPPLYDFIDPMALQGLFNRPDSTEVSGSILSFRVGRWNVFVRDDGRIRVCDARHFTDPEPLFASA